MRLWTGLVAVAAAVLALRGEDSWVKKKYTEWTEKEVRQVVTSSPWAHRTDIPLGSAMAGGGGGRGRGRGGGGRGGGGMGAENDGFGGVPGADSGLGGGGLGGGVGAVGGEGPGATPTLPVTIRWQSALPVRQAIARMRFGAEAGASQEAARLLQGQQQYYIISISGLPARLLQAMGPQRIKSGSALRLSKSESIAAAEVQVNPGQPAPELFLLFPRTREIRLEDKDVEVQSNLGSFEIRRKFRLKDMVFEGKLEL